MANPDFRDQSLLRVISVGVAAENKERNASICEVVISEQSTFINGEIKSDFKTDTASGVDAYGNAFTVTVNTANSVTAEWLGDGTNRVTAPDLRRGDRLEVLQYGEVDRFFWRARPMPGQSVRKLETVIQSYSNTRDEEDNVQSAKNSWYSEVNTHDKVWTTVQTNKNDGEPYAYTQQVDAKSGNMVLGADDVGNFVQLNSRDTLIEIQNAMNSFMHLDNGKLILEADEIIINGRKSFTVKTPKATYNEDNVTIKSSTWNANIGDTKWAGNINLNGSMNVEGGGGFNCSSTAKFTGDISHNGVNIGHLHTHMVVKEGRDSLQVTG